MAILPAPFMYADLSDVIAHAPIRPGDLNSVISKLPAGALDKLILTHSRIVDTYLSKRTETPLQYTPHLSITRYVALMVAADLQAKLGEMPDSDQASLRDDYRKELQDWIKATITSDGFCEIPKTNDGSEPGTIQTKSRTRAYSQGSPYPEGYGGRERRRI